MSDSISDELLTLAQADARARKAFFDQISVLTLTEIAQRAGLDPQHSAPLTWRQSGQIFSVYHGDIEYYPTFQFDTNGQPLRVIEELLAILRGDQNRTEWQNAFWFVSSNGWLGGDAPMDRLMARPEDIQGVITAAKHAVEPQVY